MARAVVQAVSDEESAQAEFRAFRRDELSFEIFRRRDQIAFKTENFLS